jgi:uncharacterized membrane protein YadS
LLRCNVATTGTALPATWSVSEPLQFSVSRALAFCCYLFLSSALLSAASLLPSLHVAKQKAAAKLAASVGIPYTAQPLRWSWPVFCDTAAGTAVIGVLSGLSFIIGSNSVLKDNGAEYVLWSLLLGLLAANAEQALLFVSRGRIHVQLPPWLLAAAKQAEWFIKVGLVLLVIDAQSLIAVGWRGLIVSWLLLPVKLLAAGLVCRVLMGLPRESAARQQAVKKIFTLSSAICICGTSAAAAVSSAIGGDPDDLAQVNVLIPLVNLPQILLLPYLAKNVFSLSVPVAASWAGTSIDVTSAVVATAELIEKSGSAVQLAALIKSLQNVAISPLAVAAAVIISRMYHKDANKHWTTQVYDAFPKVCTEDTTAFSILLVPVATAWC